MESEEVTHHQNCHDAEHLCSRFCLIKHVALKWKNLRNKMGGWMHSDALATAEDLSVELVENDWVQFWHFGTQRVNKTCSNQGQIEIHYITFVQKSVCQFFLWFLSDRVQSH